MFTAGLKCPSYMRPLTVDAVDIGQTSESVVSGWVTV